MNREDIEKLLGGYATGTLTPDEQQALFAAALEDQDLFDALAREQPLHDLLRDPAARAHVLAALDERPARWYDRLRGWRPAAALAGVAAAAVLAVVLVREQKPIERLQVAQVKAPAGALEPRPVEAPKAPAAKPKLAQRAAGPQHRAFKGAPPIDAKKETPSLPSPPAVAVRPPAVGERVVVLAESQPAPPPPSKPGAGTNDAALAALASARDLFYRQQFVGGQAVGGFEQAPQAAPAQQQQPTPQQQKTERQQQLPATLRAAAAANRQSIVLPRALNLGVRYTVLRRNPEGEFVKASPSDLKKGDTVKLTFETNEPGFLYVKAQGIASRVLHSSQVRGHTPYTTPALQPHERELLVSFSRQQQPAVVTGVSVDSRNRVQQVDDAVYVVGEAPLPQVTFTIKLAYK